MPPPKSLWLFADTKTIAPLAYAFFWHIISCRNDFVKFVHASFTQIIHLFHCICAPGLLPENQKQFHWIMKEITYLKDGLRYHFNCAQIIIKVHFTNHFWLDSNFFRVQLRFSDSYYDAKIRTAPLLICQVKCYWNFDLPIEIPKFKNSNRKEDFPQSIFPFR